MYETWSLRSVVEGASSVVSATGESWHGDLEAIQLPPALEVPDRLESDRGKLVDAVMNGAFAVLGHFGLAASVEVEQRIVLTHPEVPGLEFRQSGLRDVVRRDALPNRCAVER